MVGSNFVHLTESGEKIEFPRFTTEEIDSYGDQYREEYKQRVIKTAQEENREYKLANPKAPDKWNNEDLFTLKTNIDFKVIDINEIYQLARNPKWIKKFLTDSLTKTKSEKIDEILKSIPVHEKINIAQKLILDLPEEKKGGDRKPFARKTSSLISKPSAGKVRNKEDFFRFYYLKYYGQDPSSLIYTNYRIGLEQIGFIEKFNAGENILKSNRDNERKQFRENVSEEEKKAFQNSIEEAFKQKKGAPPRMKQKPKDK